MSITTQTQTQSASSINVGIAVYHPSQATVNCPKLPHWTLVIHPTSYKARDVRLYQIHPTGAHEWRLAHQVDYLPDLGDLIGVLHIGNIQYHTKEEFITQYAALDTFLQNMAPTRNREEDPSGLVLWSCQSYVIRAVARLARVFMGETTLELPCEDRGLYEYTRRRIEVLEEEESDIDGFRVMNLTDTELEKFKDLDWKYM